MRKASGAWFMGRGRRGEIHQVVSRLIALRASHEDYSILVIDRSRPTGVRRLPLRLVRGVEGGYLVLEDGTMIPLHRVVGVEDGSGRVVWRRGRGEGV